MADRREISIAGIIALAVAAVPVVYNGFEAVRFASVLLVIFVAGFSPWLDKRDSNNAFASVISRRKALFIGCLYVLFIAILVFHFGFREYYYDSADQIPWGDGARAQSFLITHARVSGIGVPNPPLFSDFMGILTAISHNPAVLNGTTSFINAAAVLAAMVYFFKWLPPLYAFASSLLMLISPFTLVYSNVMWEGSLMFPCAVAFNIFLAEFIASKSQWHFIVLVAVAAFASQNHQAGFFYFPILLAVWALHWRSVRPWSILTATATAAAICAPYMVFLFYEGGLDVYRKYATNPCCAGWILSYSDPMDPLEFKKQMPLFNIGIISPYFFRFIFAWHFDAAIGRWGVGVERIVYMVSLITGVFFIIGWARYVLWAFMRRRLFSMERDDADFFPLPFQIAGFIVTVVNLLFLAGAQGLWMKHYLLLFPAHAVIAAWLVWRLWMFTGVRIAFAVGAAASLAITLTLLLTIKEMGGGMFGGVHYYGPTYETLGKITDTVKRLLRPGESPQLLVTGTWILPLETMALNEKWDPSAKPSPISITINQIDENKFAKVRWTVRRLAERLKEHEAVIAEAINRIPPTASVAANDSVNEDDVVQMRTFNAPNPLTGTPWMMVKDRPGAVKMEEGKPMPDADFLVLDTADPRLPVSYPSYYVHDLLMDRRYGAVYHDSGVIVFKKGAPRQFGRELLLARFNTFDVEELRSGIGKTAPQGEGSGKIRVVQEKSGQKGHLVFGPYIELPAGDYSAVFRIKVDDPKPDDVPMILDVSSGGGKTVLAKKEVHSDISGKWREISVDFRVEETLAERVEFRAYYTGSGDVSFDSVRLIKSAGSHG